MPTILNRRALACAVLFFSVSAAGTAQFGVGAGIAAMGENVVDAGVNASRLVTSDTLKYNDVGGVAGVYAIGHFRYGYGGPFRLNVDVSYVYFPGQTIQLVEANVGDSSATFEVGTSLIPIGLGGEIFLPAPVFRPYLGAQVTYTIFNRTFTYVQGDPEVNTPEIRNEWSGRNQFGLAFRGGVELGLGPVAVDFGLRYNIADVFSRKTGAQPMKYLQAGVSILFGKLIESDPESED